MERDNNEMIYVFVLVWDVCCFGDCDTSILVNNNAKVFYERQTTSLCVCSDWKTVCIK